MKSRGFLTSLMIATLLAACPAPAQTLPPWPGVTITFDDGYSSLEIARPLFKQYNVVGTAFPIVGYIGTSGECTWSDLQGLLADGWEIGSHTMTHPDLTTVSDSQLDYELSMSKQLLETTLNTSVYSVALPGGAGADDPRVLSACAKYYHFVRNVDYPFQYDNLPPSPFHVYCFEAYNTTTPATVIQWIESARTNGYWLVVTFHRINQGTSNPTDEYSYGTDQLTQILEYIKNNGYPTPTLTGVFRQFPPVANAGSNQTVPRGTTVTLDGSKSSDPCAQTPLSFAWSFKSTPAGSSAVLNSANTVNPSFTPDVAGSYVVQLVATNSLQVASQAAMVTISASTPPGNSPPVANAGSAQTVHEGATVILDGSKSSDPDGDTITYAWSFTSKPTESTATLSNATIVNPTFMADKGGNYVLQLIVTDSHGAASTPASVTISTINSAPVANAGSAQTVPKGAIVTLDGSKSSDPDGDTITYAWSFTSKPTGSTAALANGTTMHPTFTADVIGSYALQLIVTDQWGAVSTPATIMVSVSNSAPVANAGPAQTVSVGATVTLDGSNSSDPDGDTITYAWTFTSKPIGSTAILNNYTTMHPTFTADKAGSYVVQLLVTDSHGAASTPASVTISTQNSAPVANAGSPQTVNLGATVTLNGSGSSDPDGDSITYAWSFTSRPTGSTAALSNATTMHPTFTADKAGSYVVQLLVTDSHGAASTPASVTISTNNSAPVANAGSPQTVSVGATVTLNGSGSSDPDGDTVTYAWSFTSRPTGRTAALSNSTIVNPTFTADKAGSYVVQLIVTDSHGAASTPASVTISTGNSAPVANAGPPQTVSVGATVTLNGSGSSDPDGDTITYAWRITSKPSRSTARLSNSTRVNPTFRVDRAGNYVVQLIVKDSHGASSTPASVTISTGNSAPVANAGPAQTVSVGATVTLDGSLSTDPNGDTITYAWSFTSRPTGSAAALANGTTVHPTFTADKAGSYVVQLIVTDSHGAASTPASVTISTNNSAPVANAGPAQTVSLGATVTLDGSLSSDPNGDTITYAWSFTSKPTGSAASLSNSTSVHSTFTADLVGNYVVQLIVTDSHGAASTPASVTITAGNSPVVIASYPESNMSDWGDLDQNMRGWGQAFTAGSSVTSVKFYLLKIGSPTGSAYAKIYAMSGTFGTNAKPTGAALATSNPVNVSTLQGSWNLVEFTFATPFNTTNGTHYIISIEYTGGSSTNVILVGLGQPSSDNVSYNWNGTWEVIANYRLCYDILGTP
jgi:peptidoglycan/xylan/chitin deacetylase (PgdA/CDA1 family)/PKD repeat protein